jgi:hypothetical protein
MLFFPRLSLGEGFIGPGAWHGPESGRN